MVDILFRLTGVSVEGPLLERATEVEVLSVWMPVLSATDMLVSKLNALNEHHCNLASVIPVARALREQIDWPKLREEVAWNDFAVAASFLLDRLQVPPPT